MSTTRSLKTSGWLSYREGRFSIMLAGIGILLFVGPMLANFTALNLFFDVSMTIFFLTSIYSVSSSRRRSVLATVTALPMMVSVWRAYFPDLPYLVYISTVSGLLFSVIVIYSTGDFILGKRRITLDMIFGSLIIYCFIGIGWGFLYAFIYNILPGSFNNFSHDVVFEEYMSQFFYFSFVTLSTLGYGDIVPSMNISRSVAVLEALTGQIFLVVIVAWLVGMKVSQDMNDNT